MKLAEKKLISVVIPVYNEQATLPLLYPKITAILDQLTHIYAWEIIFVDDGSSDTSWILVEQMAYHDTRVHSIKLSRNFGHQMALTAGYDYAQGDAVITMDADLQDPPGTIIPMINAWENGAAIVYARRKNRKDSLFKKVTAYLYYRFLHRVADVTIPRNVGDFRLLDKKVVRHLNACKEKSRYLRGMVAWSGFKHTFVDFERAARAAGSTGYSLKKMVRLAGDGLTSFSTFPLKIAGILGAFVIVSSCVIFVYQGSALYAGTSMVSASFWYGLVLYHLIGWQFITVWLLSAYVGRIYEQQKERPLYIVETHTSERLCTDAVVLQKRRHENHTAH